MPAAPACRGGEGLGKSLLLCCKEHISPPNEWRGNDYFHPIPGVLAWNCRVQFDDWSRTGLWMENFHSDPSPLRIVASSCLWQVPGADDLLPSPSSPSLPLLLGSRGAPMRPGGGGHSPLSRSPPGGTRRSPTARSAAVTPALTPSAGPLP